MNRRAPEDRHIEEVLESFENATLDPEGFDHEAHILVGWRYLQDLSLVDAITRFTSAIGRLTRKLGVPNKYHETITWFYLIKIAERCRGMAAADWPAFKAANPDLFASNPSLVERYYSEALLSSETARHTFVFPDR
jgi:hypothetical protein